MANSAIRYPVAQEVVSQLKKSGAKILGVVRNNFNRNQKIRGQK
jgi:Mrp family chromosome partitioning ATPase